MLAWSTTKSARPLVPAANRRSCAIWVSACAGGTGELAATSCGLTGRLRFSACTSPTFSRSFGKYS